MKKFSSFNLKNFTLLLLLFTNMFATNFRKAKDKSVQSFQIALYLELTVQFTE